MRVKLSFFILGILICLSIFSGAAMNKNCEVLAEQTAKVRELYEAGDTDGAYEEAERLNTEWKKFRRKTKILLNSEKLMETDRICARLPYLVKEKSDEVYSELNETEVFAEALKSGETPLLSSIF